MTGGQHRPELSGFLANGSSPVDAMVEPEVLALCVTADCIKHGEGEPVAMKFSAPWMLLFQDTAKSNTAGMHEVCRTQP
jgi:hypothetical protein